MPPSQGCCGHDHDCDASDCSTAYSLYKHIALEQVGVSRYGARCTAQRARPRFAAAAPPLAAAAPQNHAPPPPPQKSGPLPERGRRGLVPQRVPAVGRAHRARRAAAAVGRGRPRAAAAHPVRNTNARATRATRTRTQRLLWRPRLVRLHLPVYAAAFVRVCVRAAPVPSAAECHSHRPLFVPRIPSFVRLAGVVRVRAPGGRFDGAVKLKAVCVIGGGDGRAPMRMRL